VIELPHSTEVVNKTELFAANEAIEIFETSTTAAISARATACGRSNSTSTAMRGRLLRLAGGRRDDSTATTQLTTRDAAYVARDTTDPLLD
jgi:hypothetical protein